MQKKHLLKKSLAVLMAVSMTAAIAGCGDSGSSSSGDTAPATEGTESTSDSSSDADAAAGTETAAADDLFGEETSIRVMVWDRGDAAPGTTTEDNNMTQWIKDQVKEKFNINVEYVAVPRSSSDEQLNVMMAGNTAPDIVFTYDQTLYYNFANSGALTELSDSYAKYGSDIEKYCGEAQPISVQNDQKFAVMKIRGLQVGRHRAYIRQDLLDELQMEMPKTKEELGEYLYAVKDLGYEVPWAMGGRNDTEKMYLNFLGSYVDLSSERDAYIYSEAYIAMAPGTKDGLKLLNQWYNDGLITQEFPTDASEEVYKADIANNKVGFLLDDGRNPHESFEVLNNELGHRTFVPVQCFDLPDGTYRNPAEPRFGMFVMIPATSSDKVDACMKYLNWMADPVVAQTIRFTPDKEPEENGAYIAFTKAELEERGYPGTCDDLTIMNLNYPWSSDLDICAQLDFEGMSTEWETLDWWKSYYEASTSDLFVYPTYAYISEDEQQYGADIKTRMVDFVYTMICCPSDQFESTYEARYNELVNAGLQKILDARAAYYDSVN